MKKTLFTRIAAVFAVIMLLMASMAIAASAEVNPAVGAAENGVFLLIYTYPYEADKNNGSYVSAHYSTGSAFMIDQNYLITANHVIHNDDPDVVAARKAAYGDKYQDKYEIRIYIGPGRFVRAQEVASASDSVLDYSVLKITDTVSGKNALTLSSEPAEDIQRGESLYALGYSYRTVYETASKDSFTAKDVDFVTGNFSKMKHYGATDHILHTAATAPGMSGGPLLNEKGEVVGINIAASNDTESENYALPISHVISALQQRDIPFTASNGSTDSTSAPADGEVDKTALNSAIAAAAGIEDTAVASALVEAETVRDNADASQAEVDAAASALNSAIEAATPAEVDKSALSAVIANAESKDEKEYKDFSDVKAALEEAKKVKDDENATQDDVNTAETALKNAIDKLEEKAGLSTSLIIAIAAGVVVLIVIILIIVIAGKKKKADVYDDAPASGSYNGAAPSGGGFVQSSPAASKGFVPSNPVNDVETGVLSGNGPDTTVLDRGAADTTVLAGKPYAKLTRKGSGDVIQVANNPFIIGKQATKVNYCIEDNATISRSHAKIMKSGGKVCVVDLGSKNGTSVNGVRCTPGNAYELNDGAKLTLSDEDFTVSIL